jgi:hypothetical protein
MLSRKQLNWYSPIAYVSNNRPLGRNLIAFETVTQFVKLYGNFEQNKTMCMKMSHHHAY